MLLLRYFGVTGRLVLLVLIGMAGLFVMEQSANTKFETASIDMKEVELTHLTDVAESIARTYHERAEAGEMTAEQAQAAAAETIAALRFEGDNYFFVFDMDHIMIAHGANPTLNGRDVGAVTDPNGVALFSEMTRGVSGGENATVWYQWPAPGAQEGQPPIDKISVVQLFEPWGWVIGAGAYLLDIEAAQASISQNLRRTELIIAAVMALAALAVGFSVVRPLSKLTARMASMSDGDTESEVPYAKDRSAFGKISRTLETFRLALIEQKELQAKEAERVEEEAKRDLEIAAERQASEAKQREIEQKALDEKRRLEAEAQAEKARLAEQEMAVREAAANEQEKVVVALGDALKKLSVGDLTAEIQAEFPPTYEQIKADFNTAVKSLQETVGTVINKSKAISHEVTDISSAAEDLSVRTERQASTLGETAAALEELAVSVQSAADAAGEVSKGATEAKSTADRGGDIAEKAVDAMESIKASSDQIQSIIKVIEDIAFQTNLLALNAGVEAARAGESGRGFAVVATEVRALAQRSSEAALEINQLISESGERVEQGFGLVGETRTALGEILESVSEISEQVTGIAKSASEQAQAIKGINNSVNELDSVTQQNAAMFEETTAATQALNQETGLLVKAVDQFELGGKPTSSSAPAVPMVLSKPVSPARPASAPARATGGATAQPARRVEAEEEIPEGWEDF